MSDYQYPKSPEKTIFIKNGEGKIVGSIIEDSLYAW